jgi:PAS domain S-box-containing protein
MPGSDPLLSEMAKFGLSSFEAKAYLALLRRGPSSANEISKKIGMNRTQAYVLMKGLVEKGVVLQQLGRPSLYEPVEPRAMIQIIVKNQRSLLGDMEKAGESLSLNLSQVPASHDEDFQGYSKEQPFKMISGNLCAEKIMGIIESAREGLLFFSSSEIFQMNYELGMNKVIEKAASRSVEIKINIELDSLEKEMIATVKKLKEFGSNVQVKHSPASYSYIISDTHTALLGITCSGKKNCLIARNKDFVKNLKEAFDERWQIAQPVDERIAELGAHVSAEEHKHYQSFVNKFQGIAYRTDMGVNLIFICGTSKEMTGYTNEDLLSKRVVWDNDIMHPDYQENTRLEYTKMNSIPDYRTESEYRIIRKDNKIRWVHEVWHNVCDKNGKPIYIEGYIYDVTDRRENEEKSKQSDWMLNIIHTSIPIAAYSSANDESLSITRIADTIFNLTGYAASEWLSRKVSRQDFACQGKRADYLASIRKAVLAHQPFCISDLTITDRQNKIHFLEERGKGIFDQAGKLLRIDGVFMGT